MRRGTTPSRLIFYDDALDFHTTGLGRAGLG